MFDPILNNEPESTLGSWLANVYDQLSIVYRDHNNLVIHNSDVILNLDDKKDAWERLVNPIMQLIPYQMVHQKTIETSTTVTETVTDFLFCVLDFAIQVDSIYLDELKFEDENYQQSLLEETSILIAVVQATSGYILENNL
jgi:hypothetical protein